MLLNGQSVATVNEIGNQVIANPSGTAASTLTDLQVGSVIYHVPQGGGGSGTTDYTELTNKPKINGTELAGNHDTSYYFTAGTGISFSGSIISATELYTASSGITISGTTIGHSNAYSSASTLAVYPMTVDAYGHVASIGSSVAIPSDTYHPLI